MIELKKVSKKYKEQLVLKDVDLSIKKCGFYAFFGKSGSGKSTLINIINKSLKPSSGELITSGKIIKIYQNYELFDELNVIENVCLYNENINGLDNILRKLNIDQLKNQYPKELSGGQKQRVGIARAILLNPDIILCDEPFEALDFENKLIVLEYLKDLSKTKIVIVISHDINLVKDYADVLYCIEDRHLLQKYEQNTNDDLKINTNEIEIDLNRIIKKINRPKKIRDSIILFSVIFIFMTMYFLINYFFNVEKPHNLINLDYIYYKGETGDTKILNEFKNKPIGIIEFEEIRIANKKINANVYPAVGNDIFKIDNLQAKELIVNQNVAKLVDKGENISLSYIGFRNILNTEMKIVDVIEEDTSLLNIYYNLDYIKESFDKKEDIEVPFDQYILNNSDLKMVEVGYDNIAYLKHLDKANDNIEIISPSFEEYESKVERLSLYKMINLLILIIYSIFVFVGIALYINADFKKNLRNYVLLLEIKEDYHTILKGYLLTVFKSILRSILSIISLCCLVNYLNYKCINWSIFIGVPFLFILDYFISSFLFPMIFKKSKQEALIK